MSAQPPIDLEERSVLRATVSVDVRVHYRQGGEGAAGDVAVSWEGRWPPRPFALASSMGPSCLTCDQPDAG
jgi:hypothetical protein